MAIDLPHLLMAARDTVQMPRAGARALINMNLPVNVGWLGVILMAVASAALSAVTFVLSPPSSDPAMEQALTGMFANPIQLAVFQTVALIIGAMLIYRVGRMFGGAGRFADALVLIGWLEFVLLLLQAVQLALLLISTPLAAALGMFGLVLFLWLLTNFIAELHGFRSLLAVFFAIIGTTLVVSFAAAILIVAVVGVGA